MQPADFLSLVVEVSITIAGFSGIVIVLGRRARGEWSPRDQIQLRALLLSSMMPLAISGLGLFLLTTELTVGSVWRICSVFAICLFGFHATTGIRRARQSLKNEIDPATIYVLYSVSISVILLLGLANTFAIVAFWPIALLLVWMIGLSLFNFIQLLWRATVEEAN